MKKNILFAAAALLALAACTKVETAQDVQREINFEVANSLTKATGSVYSNGAFGTYAWFNNTDDFMVNEQVDLSGGVWKTVDYTFYWPKTGTISFISYSPFYGTSNTAGTVPVVTKNSITYTGVTAGTTDLMYADRATCSSNVNVVTDSDIADSGYSGVPTVFRHALAKVSFKIRANFLTSTDPTTNTTTTWEVTVKNAQISGFKTTGDLALTLNGNNWDKPVTNIGTPEEPVNVNVWTNLSGATTAQELVADTENGVVLTTTAQDLNSATGFVIPQVLTADAQKLELNIHIKTTLSNGKVIEEDYKTTGFDGGTYPPIDIKDISSLKAWEINQNIVYTINIKPTATTPTGSYDNPNDVIITFDPAVADWTTVDAAATIQL